MTPDLLYTALYMSARRTQVYLTREQRARLDEVTRREGMSLAEVIRRAVDEYLDRSAADVKEAFDATFGVLPELEVPSREEWDRGFG
ncbi:MAG: ribbon-helix-helix domain-containing protein [Actinomycetota bacterium]|nr:ribbon-helix-helix domain-containing protein [Actinomycetota bacterium]